MLVESEGQLQLGADPIGGSNQHRFGYSDISGLKARRTPDIRKDPVDMGLGYDGFDTETTELPASMFTPASVYAWARVRGMILS